MKKEKLTLEKHEKNCKCCQATNPKKWEDYGESSLTLLAVYCGIDKKEPAIPYDPSDFRRCVHIIECLNLNLEQEKSLLHNTMNQYPEWKPFVKNWGKLMALYLKERNQDSAPELYRAMLNLRKYNEMKDKDDVTGFKVVDKKRVVHLFTARELMDDILKTKIGEIIDFELKDKVIRVKRIK